MAISHAGHNHPATPAGRRACRAANGHLADTIFAVDATPVPEIKMTGATARKLARHAALADMRAFTPTETERMRASQFRAKAARIQPRRGGARVSPADSTCVQAALHTDAHGGMCACGWTAKRVSA